MTNCNYHDERRVRVMDYLKNYTATWLSHRGALQNLLKVIEEKDLAYKPWENGMSFADLVTHTVGATSMFTKIVKDGSQPSSGKPESVTSLEKLIAYVNEQTDQTKNILESLTEEQLQRTVQFGPMSMTGQAMLEMSKDHEIHHKGQLFTYARLCGVKELPFFVDRSAN